jgi:hypothetical protein
MATKSCEGGTRALRWERMDQDIQIIAEQIEGIRELRLTISEILGIKQCKEPRIDLASTLPRRHTLPKHKGPLLLSSPFTKTTILISSYSRPPINLSKS